MAKTRQEIHDNRPTSPHLSIYRWQISMVLSIFHRLSGIALFFGLAIIAWWFILLVFNNFDSYFLQISDYLLIKLALYGISFAGFYHFCTGWRHLIWDTGRCLSIKAVNITGWLAIIGSIIMTLWFWL